LPNKDFLMQFDTAERELKIPAKLIPLFWHTRHPTYLNANGEVTQGKFWKSSNILEPGSYKERCRCVDKDNQLVPEAFVVDAGYLRTRYYVLYGGRAASKSHTIATALALRMSEERLQALCCREIQSSMSDSVHKLIGNKIEDMGLADDFDIQVKVIRHVQNGSEVAFEGLLHNVAKIRSFEGAKICWVEEATSVTEESWDVLIPTIRMEDSEIWIGFNTDLEDDPTYRRFVLEADDDMTVIMVNYTDNPFLSAVSMREALKLKAANYEKYLHVWEGHPRRAGEGGVFTPEMMPIIDALPAGTWYVRGWDFASTAYDPKAPPSREPDWTRGVLLGKQPSGRYVLADVKSVRGKPHIVNQLLDTTARNDGWSIEQSIPRDPGQAGDAQVAHLLTMLSGCRVHNSLERGSKEERAFPFASQVNVGNVDMLRAPWNDEMVKEMASFPDPRFKRDLIDASSRAFSRLHEPRGMQRVKVTGL
jgi:predicted phage terminase large subunit-like protein